MNSKNLKYRVHSVTSEAQPGMAGLLAQGSSHWQSQRSCTYPQEITIQFYLPMLTKSLTIMFHQYKIPTLVEVFIKAVSNQKYRRLGYIKPGPNDQTGFEEKQVKTLYFEFPCSFIRLVLHKNYVNQYNIFNQIALQEVAVEGQLMPPELLKTYDFQEVATSDDDPEPVEESRQSVTRSQPSKAMEGETREQFQKVYEELDRRKIRAVQKEDYQTAAVIKAEVKKLKQYEEKLRQLEIAKKVALNDEDYEKCGWLKSQVQLVMGNAQVQINRILGLQTSEYQTEQRSTLQMKNMTAIPVRYMDYSSLTAQKSILHQNQIVPAVLHKNNVFNPNPTQILEEYPPAEEKLELVKLESLDSKIFIHVQKHFPYIREEIWRQVLTKNYKVKEKAFNELSKIVLDTPELVMACLELCSITISDTHTSILIHTLILINSAIKSNVVLPSSPHPPFCINSILQGLIALFPETNPKIKQLSISTYIDIPQLSIVPISLVCDLIVGKKAAKIKQNPKALQTKLYVMTQLSTRYQFSEEGYLEVLNWGVCCLEDSNNEVRTQAGELITKGLLPIVGEDIIKKTVRNVRPNILNYFMLQLNQSISMEKEPENTHRKEAVDQSEFYELSQQSDNRQELVVQSNHQLDQTEKSGAFELTQCNYCFLKLPQHCTLQMFGVHLQTSCKALVTCDQCSEKVYIRELTKHLVKDCQYFEGQLCKRCGLAFSVLQISTHEASMVCLPLHKSLERCQKCGHNVSPNDNAWVMHAFKCNC